MQTPPKIMSREEIANARPYPLSGPIPMQEALEKVQDRLKESGSWAENQVLGRRYPMGCVALEITQRCNLDCTLCYLSEHSESVKDIPLSEVYRRMDQIRNQYGPGMDVQITGGDPTMRNRDELIEIIRRVRQLGMRPTLMTNGIKATRSLLEALVKVGLYDVAFHVDTTQERKGYSSERELNKVRDQYIERTKGLPLHVIFNTTVHKGNYHEIPELIRFFRSRAEQVGMCSFQLQADTGRGMLRKRDDVITLEGMKEKIQEGAGTPLVFDALQVGHRDCNYYSATLVANGTVYDLLDQPEFVARFVRESAGLELKRNRPVATAVGILQWGLKNPGILGGGMKYVLPKLGRMATNLIQSKGRVHKLSFFIHNFMDGENLECDRINACSFMVMTDDGPISMCLHNAKRDTFILKPLSVTDSEGTRTWNPLTGELAPQA